MGFIEGYNERKRVAETIFRVSAKFTYVYDPELDRKLRGAGITESDIQRLCISPTIDPEDIGYKLAGVIYCAQHGAIWNPGNQY